MTDTLEIPARVWYDPPEAPPVAAENRASLVFIVRPATRDGGPSLALLASYWLGWPYTEMYGRQLPAPVFAFAVDADTGAVHVAPIQRLDRSRQRTVTVHLGNEEAASAGPLWNRRWTGGRFGCDLPDLLGLPPAGGTYYVGLWLDDLVTAIQVATVPPRPPTTAPNTDDRPVTPAPNQPPPDWPGVTAATSKFAPGETAGEIRTDRPDEAGDGKIHGRVPKAALDVSPRAEGIATDPRLAVLAFRQRTRAVASASADIYAKLKASDGCFAFDPFALIARPSLAEHVYVLTVLGTLRSEVLWIPGFTAPGDGWTRSLESAIDDDDD